MYGSYVVLFFLSIDFMALGRGEDSNVGNWGHCSSNPVMASSLFIIIIILILMKKSICNREGYLSFKTL